MPHFVAPETRDELLKQILGILPVSIWIYSSKSEGWNNGRWAEYTGLTEEELSGWKWLSTVHPDDVHGLRQILERSLERGEPYRAHYRVRGRDGIYRWFVSRAVRISSSDPNEIVWVGITTEAQSLREETDGRLEFLGMIAHEIRTPLTVIKSGFELLQKGKLPPDSSAKLLSLGLRAADRMSSLVDDIVEVSDARAGDTEHRPSECDLSEMLEETARNFTRLLEDHRQHRLEWEIERPLRGYWDSSRICQAVESLLQNALKFSPDGGTLQLRASLDGQRSELHIEITDPGIGIREEDQKRVFYPFQKAADSRHFGGFGLGLYLVQRIVQKHRGQIRLRSQPGQGSRFTLLLPTGLPMTQGYALSSDSSCATR